MIYLKSKNPDVCKSIIEDDHFPCKFDIIDTWFDYSASKNNFDYNG